jgi:hypothetical protein
MMRTVSPPQPLAARPAHLGNLVPDLAVIGPTLFIRGDEESPETDPAERFKECAGGPCDVEIVPNCNHFYVGREAAICELVSGWLVRTLNITAGVRH